MRNENVAVLTTVVGGVSAAKAFEEISDYVSTTTAVFQTELARAPQLTEEVYKAALQATDMVSSRGLYLGLVYAARPGQQWVYWLPITDSGQDKRI